MIAYARRLIVEHVLTPQTLADRGELRAYLDPVARPLDAAAQEIDLLAVTTRPLEEEIGGGVTLRHEISVGVVVQHGDDERRRQILDGIVLEIVLRSRDAWDDLANDDDPATGQYPTRLSWSVDWRPLLVDTPNDSATVTFTLDTQLDR